MTETGFDNKVRILAEFSIKYRRDPRFSQLFDESDLGFPYAFGVQHNHFEPSKTVTLYIEDTFTMLLIALLPDPGFGDARDTGFSNLDELEKASRIEREGWTPYPESDV